MKKSRFVLSLFFYTILTFPVHAYDDHSGKAHAFPEIISVPTGFQPEGVVRGHGPIAYVGSLLSESIYKVDLRTGKGSLLVDHASGNAVVGMAYDKRSNYIFTAGGPFGTVSVFNAANGNKMAQFDVAAPGTFINDGIVTRQAAYFTDSFAPVIYRIPLSKNGQLPEADEVETIELSGDFEFVPGNFNGNGIEQSKRKGHLILVNSANGKLYDVDGRTGETVEITIDNGNVNSGDGLYLRDDKLYVVQNFLNQITELELADDGMSVTITRIITNPNFRIPTTATVFGDALYAINARFDVAPPPFFGNPPADPALDYELVKIKIGD